MFAPVVAFVPTPHPGTCGVLSGPTENIHANVLNNMTALFVVGGLALLILAVLSVRALPSRPARLGYAGAAAMWLGALLVFLLDDDFFIEKAHETAAALMFFFIFIVVCINALQYRDEGPATSLRNRYGAIAIAMGVSFVAFPIAGKLGWNYWVLGIEVALISLFAAFWMIQTRELWHEGLR
jgi:hypothetical protein